MGIAVKNLVKSFGTYTVIHSISFDVAEGEFVTPSRVRRGCGKTTTLRCIAGLENAKRRQHRHQWRNRLRSRR